jgi:glycosyltransferase involved in cell wall biosynthesis
MYILIDGYNLSLKKGTGVANYGRNLASTLSLAGYEVGIVFPYKTKNKIKGDKNIKALLATLELVSGNITELSSRKSLIILYLFQVLLNQYQIKDLQINQELVVAQNPNSDLSKYRILCKNAIFQFAHIFFKLTNQLLPVKVPDDVDVVHWTYPIPIKAINKPNIYTIHDLVPMRLPYTTLDDKKFYIKSMAKICKTASQIVAVSNNTKEDLCNFFEISEQKVFVSWQSSTFDDLTPRSSLIENNLLKDYQLHKKDYFIFIGNIEPKKNIKRLIQGYLMSRVFQKIIIVGAKAWKSEEELAQLDQIKQGQQIGSKMEMANKVKLLEYLPKQEIIPLLANARALLFPSLYEGFGLPVLEAMQLGVPVLTSNTSSLPEVAGDAALYVNPYSVEEISLGIHKLSIDNELCAELSQKGMARAKQFNIASYQERMINFYESFLKNKKN